jgi:hypothetical protein
MDAFEIARGETRRMARGSVPLVLLTYAVFALAGYYGWGTVLGLALGSAYAVFNFSMMAHTAVRGVLMGDPALARRLQSSRYVLRYLLTGLLMFGAIKCPYINAVAAAVPLFYPKAILAASGIFQKKGG